MPPTSAGVRPSKLGAFPDYFPGRFSLVLQPSVASIASLKVNMLARVGNGSRLWKSRTPKVSRAEPHRSGGAYSWRSPRRRREPQPPCTDWQRQGSGHGTRRRWLEPSWLVSSRWSQSSPDPSAREGGECPGQMSDARGSAGPKLWRDFITPDSDAAQPARARHRPATIPLRAIPR